FAERGWPLQGAGSVTNQQPQRALSIRVNARALGEVAVELHCSPSWVREHANKKARPHIPRVKMGGLLRFRRQDIEDFIKTWCQ
ncbi:MAG: helix-turn-helix domain-containing protein, partial [Acidobacteria bacterium]|nr:helix-turn-helix domain-containing protein [Acidobacteriota bacterium]